MKKWFCPNCKTFKMLKRTQAGAMGYPDTYHCRCCGTELYNAKEIIKDFLKKTVYDHVEKNDA